MIYWQDMVRFIRAVSRIQLGPDQKQFVSQFVKEPVPWEHLILLAQSEGVDGLLYHHLNHLDEIAIPESIWDRLKDTYQTYRQTQLNIEKEAEFISYHLEAKELSAIALQGLSLFQVYETPGLRPVGDLDILVKISQYDEVVSLLKNIGFSVPNPVYPNNLRKNGLWLDIHTHILNLDRIKSRQYIFPKDLSALWNRAVPIFPSTKGLLMPDSIDNFVLLSAHTLKHSYSRMIWLADLNESLIKFIAVPHRWNQLIERAKYWGQEKIVLYGLIVSEGILDRKIPVSVKRALGYEKLGLFEKHVLRLKIKGVALPSYCIALWIFAIKGTLKKIKFLKETMFPRDDIMSQIYLESKTQGRFLQTLNRFVHTLLMVGNGIKQALYHGPFGRP